MSTEIIKEFLVSLGYKVDETGQRKFVDGIHNVTVEATKLGLAAASAAAAVAAAVVKMSSDLENLYFMSQRTGASAANIQALGFAASQMGSSVEGARGSIEGLAKFLRENPGGEGLLGSIGVQTRDANGALRDTSDIMQDIGKRLRNMPQYRAIAYANVFGIDYKTLLALEHGVGKFSDRYKDLLHRFGLNVDEATKKSHALMVSWRDMKASAGILSTIVGTTLIDVFDELQHRWQSLDETTKENIVTGAKWVAGIVAGFALLSSPIAMVAALAAGIVALWDDYKVWKEGGQSLIDWGKWKPEVELATKGVDALVYAIKELIRVKKLLENAATDTVDYVSKSAARYAHKIHEGSTPQDKREQNSPLHKALKYLARIAGYDPNTGKRYPTLPMDDPRGPVDSSSTSAGGQTRGIRNNNPGNIKYGAYARSLGATGQDSAGFAIFPNAAAGLKAINANLASYGRQGFNTPASIATRWSTTDQGAYTKRLADMFGGDPNKSLNMQDPGVINALRNGIILQENGRNPYGMEIGKGGDSSPGLSSGMALDQKVTINLHGVSNPHDVASAVTSGMNSANDRLVRNLKSATS